MRKEFSLDIPENYKTGTPVYLDAPIKIQGSPFIQYKNIVITNSTLNNEKLVLLKISKDKWPEVIKISDNIIIKIVDKSLGPNIGLSREKLFFFPNGQKLDSDFTSSFIILPLFALGLILTVSRSKKIRVYFARKRIVASLKKLIHEKNKREIRNLLESNEFYTVESSKLQEFSIYFNSFCFKNVDQNEFYNKCMRYIK